jgi:hypothetical protein
VPPTRSAREASGSRRASDDQPRVSRVVLAVGTDDWAIEQSAATLESAGHTVLRCHEPGEDPFPCNAFRAGRRCPIDAGVDAVVTSRARPVAMPAPTETGVVCGLRAGVPLVLNGISRNSPFNELAVEVVGEQGDLAHAVAQATSRPTVIDLDDPTDRRPR